jgi:hypothetical protein
VTGEGDTYHKSIKVKLLKNVNINDPVYNKKCNWIKLICWYFIETKNYGNDLKKRYTDNIRQLSFISYMVLVLLYET